MGWVGPDAKTYVLKRGESHELVAARLLKRYYPKWNWCNASKEGLFGGSCYATKALQFKGWIRVAGGGNYGVWSVMDKFSGNMQRNLIDLIATLSEDDMVYVDAFEGDTIYNKSAGYLVEKYQ